MSECVVRMEMPGCCWDCPCLNGEYGFCQADKDERQTEEPNERPSWCPIICQLPEGHGRLVDMKDIDSMMENASFTPVESVLYSLVYRDDLDFDGLPAIVPAEAERSETKQV